MWGRGKDGRGKRQQKWRKIAGLRWYFNDPLFISTVAVTFVTLVTLILL